MGMIRPWLRQSHQGGVVHGMGLGDVGQILAGGKPGLQDHRVLLRGNHFPVDVQLCIVQLAFQDLIGAVFLYLVPVVAGSPALGAQDLKFAEITGSLGSLPLWESPELDFPPQPARVPAAKQPTKNRESIFLFFIVFLLFVHDFIFCSSLI